MKPLLFVLLAASLAANVVLGVLARRSASSESTAASSAATGSSASGATVTADPSRASTAGAKPSGGAASPGAAPVGAVWHTAQTEQDLHRVVADLRSVGYPANVIRAVVNQLLTERFAGRSPTAGQPFWKQSSPTPETVAAQAALNNERQALFESLLGPDARASATLDRAARERRYGALPDEKIDAIAKIERDYQELTAETWAKRRGNAITSSEAMMQTQQLMEKEKLADMAAVLTPEELKQYELRNSPAARTLINNLRNVEITEPEYAQLYQAQKAFEEANPRRTVTDQNSYLQRVTAQMALNEQARSVLGDSRFYAYAEGADFNYAQVAKALTPHPSVTPAAAYQVYQLQIELQTLMSQSTRGGQPSPEKIAELRTTVESYNTRLEALLGAEAAEAYRKQGMGRMFMNYRNAPARPSGG